MSVEANCIAAAADTLSHLDKTDLKRYVVDVYDKAREYVDMVGEPQAAIERAMKEVNNEHAAQYIQSLRQTAKNSKRINRLINFMRDKKLNALELLVRRGRNEAENAESYVKFAYGRLMDQSFNIFTDEEIKMIVDKSQEIEVAKAMDGKVASEVAQGLAEKLKNYGSYRNAEEVNSGSIPLNNLNPSRFFRTIHNPSKLLSGGRSLAEAATKLLRYDVANSKALWVKFIKPFLNMEVTFKNTDARILGSDPLAIEIDDAKVDQILGKIFDDIVQGNPLTVGEGSGSQEMFFYWKDNESWVRYNQKYGYGNLHNALVRDIKASSHRIGMANFFGSNSTKAYNEIVKAENEMEHKPGKVLKDKAKITFDYLQGNRQGYSMPRLSNFTSAIMGLTGTAKLAFRLTLLSIPDIANVIMYAQRNGARYTQSYGAALRGLFDLLPDEERKHIAGLAKEITNAHVGNMMRYIDENNPSSVISRFNTFLYRITYMDGLDSSNKISAELLTARIMGNNAKFSFNELNDGARGVLNKFNITENEWEILRKKTYSIKKGNPLLTVDSVKNISDEELRKIYGEDGRSLYELRNELHNKMYSLLDVASENAVLTPGMYVKAMTNIPSNFHPIVGEIFKSIMQFKMYGLEYLDRVIYQGLRSADGVQNKLKFAAMLAGATLPASWLVNHLDNIFQGKTDPDWSRLTRGEKIKYSAELLFPGGSIFLRFLDPKNQNQELLTGFFKTPSMQFYGNALSAVMAGLEGYGLQDPEEQKKFQQAIKRLARSIAPGQGFPFVGPYERQMFGEKPYLEPGQQLVYGA